MSELIGLLIVLVVLALVGHGLWVVGRTLFRAIRRVVGTDGPRPIEARMCPRCGEAQERRPGAFRCLACNWPGHAAPDRSRARDAVGLLLQRLHRYQEAGLLPPPDGDRLAQLLSEERARLAGRPGERDSVRPSPSVGPVARPAPREPEPELVPAGPPEAPKPRLDVADRVRAYRDAREEDRSRPPAPEIPEPKRRANFGGLLASFMEERNIRWGELVGGLLIVGCSLALVVGYWDRIAERPMLRFGLANGVVAAFFAVGLHAERRWRLPTTALGLLVIATLLVPLGVLAIVSAGGGTTLGPGLLIGELLALGLFFALIGQSGRSTSSATPWETAVGVAAPSAAILAAGRWAAPGVGGSTLMALVAVPLLSHGAATLRAMLAARRRDELDEPAADDLLRVLGMTAFAAAVAVGAVLERSGATADVLRRLAPLAPLAGAPALAAGLLAWRKAGPTLVGHRVAGGAIASAGTMLMLAGVALAWPEPSGIVAVAALDGAVLLALALAFELPAALALAGGCLAVAGLVASRVIAGPLTWTGVDPSRTAEALTSAGSGAALVPIALTFELAAFAVLRAGRRPEAKALGLVSTMAGLGALALVTWHGLGEPGDPAGATWAYAALAAATLAGAGATSRRPLFDAAGPPAESRALAWAGSALLLAALVQGFVYRYAEPWTLAIPWSSALLGHATIAVGLAGSAFGRRSDEAGHAGAIRHILLRSALVTSAIAAVWLAWSVPDAGPIDLAGHLLWLAGVWLAMAWLVDSRRLFWAFQAALTGSAGFAVASWAMGRPWFGSSPEPWLDPRVFQAEGIALALLGMSWIGVRLGARVLTGGRTKLGRLDAARWLMEPPWPTFDRLATAAAVLILVALAVYGAMPGVAQELTPRAFAKGLGAPVVEGGAGRPVPPASAFEVAGIPHRPALGTGSWLLLGALLLTLLAGQWERFRRLDLLGAMLVASMAVPMAAGRWEGEVAVASALRWGGAMGMLALSAPIWARGRLAVLADWLGWRIGPDRTDGLGTMAIALVVSLAALPVVAMAGYAGGAALHVHPPVPGLADLWRTAGVVFLVLAAVGIVGPAIAESARPGGRPGRLGVMRTAGGLLLALGALGMVAVTALVVGSALGGDPIVGPEPGSFFGRIGLAASYAPPIVLVALTLVGFAGRERSPGFALAGGLLLGFGATVGWLLSGTVAARPSDPSPWIRLAQLNAIVGSLYALSWMGAVAAWRRRSLIGPEARGPALAVQAALPMTLVVLVVAVGVLGLFWDPAPTPARGAIADPMGWAAFALASWAAFTLAKRTGRAVSLGSVATAVPLAAAMLAFGTSPRDAGDWFSYHAMIVAQAGAAAGLLLFGWNRRGARPEGPEQRGGKVITRCAAVAMWVVVLFAMRAYGSDPVEPTWWSVGGLATAAVLSAMLAGWSAGRGFLYLAGGLLNLAATLWWFDLPSGRMREATVNLFIMNVIVLAMPAPAWLWVELRAIRPARGDGRVTTPFHRVAARGSLAVLALVVLAWLFGDASGGWEGPSLGIGWALTMTALAVALASGFWDDRSRGEVAGLYLLGLCGSGWVVAGLDMPPAMMSWVGAVVLASFAVIAGAAWSGRGGLRRLGDRLGVPRSGRAEDPDAGLGWLVPANVGLSAVVVALAFGVVLTEGSMLARFSVGKAALATSLAIGLLARGERRSALRTTALGFGAAGALCWSWAWIDPGSATAMLDRAVAALVTMLATAAGYGLGLVTLAPRATRWARAARRLVPALLGMAGVALFWVIGGELVAAATGASVAISGPALVATAAALLGGAVAALVAAVVPGRDPLGLPERRRTLYVYGAEAMLALLALHLGLTMSWMFAGVFARYWPVIVLGLAFAGVGLGELFRRQGRLVLAEPLERTGAVLPMLPLLGAFWLSPRPGEDTMFLVLAGALYATLALLRSSTGFGAMAALAFNAGLWTVLGRREGLGLLEHPQFWVVPPALCVLAGAYLNRDRLGQGRSAAVRHVAAGAVYLSSTADLVLNGVAEDPWLPLVLGGLSLAGILAGIALRVRGFLLLGTAFLGLSIFAMIWYAAVDLRQTWLWAASGIVAGIAILAAFALFEKRRREVMEVVERIRHWQA